MKIHRTVLLVTGVLLVPAALANRGGPASGLSGGPANSGTNCMLCHGNATGSGSVSILGMPPTFEPDTVYDLVVRIADPDQAGAGFEISAEDGVGGFVGTLIRSDTTNTRFTGTNTNYISHNGTGVNNAVANWAGMGNAAEYHVQWRSPAAPAGPVIFYAAGNAIDNDHSNFGDIVYLTSFQSDPAAPCVGDLDGSGDIGLGDLAVLLVNYGRMDNPTPEEGDLDEDGDVDLEDLASLLAIFGTSC